MAILLVAAADGLMAYLQFAPIFVLGVGSGMAGAAGGRSGRGFGRAPGLSCSPPLLIAAWLAQALRWYQQGGGLLLDGEGGIGVGANLGDAVCGAW